MVQLDMAFLLAVVTPKHLGINCALGYDEREGKERVAAAGGLPFKRMSAGDRHVFYFLSICEVNYMPGAEVLDAEGEIFFFLVVHDCRG